MIVKRRADSARAVFHRRVRATEQWVILQREIGLFTPAQLQQLSLATIYRRIASAKNSDPSHPPLDPEHPVTLPSFLCRNAHQQVFTTEQEEILANNINQVIESKYRVVNKPLIRKMATDYYYQLHPRAMRTSKVFAAVAGFIASR